MKNYYIAFKGRPADLETATTLLDVTAMLHFDSRPIHYHKKDTTVVVEFQFLLTEKFEAMYNMFVEKIKESEYRGCLPKMILPA